MDVPGIDYYRLLGVKPTATADEIRDAYRRLARRYHPDCNPEWEDDVQANRQMAQLNEAYAVLRDPARRAEYDRRRWAYLQQQAQRARYYEQAQTRKQPIYQTAYERTWEYVRTAPQSNNAEPDAQSTNSAPSQLVFVPPTTPAIANGVLLISIALLAWTIAPLNWGRMAFGAIALLVGTLFLMATITYFQGYIVLTSDRLIEYPTFGLWEAREYRYEQICDVQEQVFRYKSSTVHYIVISYFKQDDTGHWDVTRYHCHRLMCVRDHDALLHALRVRAQARKFLFSKPTLSAAIIELGQLTGILATILVFVTGFIVITLLKT